VQYDEKAVTTMTTERHAWASAQVPSVTVRHAASPICGCGQDLDVCTGSHCPRCGTSIVALAA